MKVFSLLLLLLFIVFNSNGQVNDRLESILKNDSIEIPAKISQIQQLIKAEKGLVNDTVMVEYYLKLSGLARKDQDFVSAIDYCDTLLDNYKKLGFDRTIKIEEFRARVYKASGQTDLAVAAYLSILSDYEDKGNFEESSRVNNTIGIIFLKMGEYESAEYHLLESVHHARKAGNKSIEASSLMSLGNRNKNEGRFEEAESYYKESIALCEKEGFKRLLAGNYNNIGSLFRMQGNKKKALYYFNLAVKMNLELGNERWLSYNYNNIGNLHNDQSQHKQALEYFFKSNEIKKRLNDPRGMYSTYLNIAATYDSIGNYEQAYNYYIRYSELKDSLEEVDKTLLNKKLAAEFQAEKREAQIIQLNMQGELDQKEIEARDERISYQNFLGWMMGFGIFLVIAIAVIIWRSALNRKKANIELVQKNEQIDAQHGEIIDSINYAKRIQNSILPSQEYLQQHLGNYGLLYKPKDIVSGDFYVCDATSNGLYFGAVDCTGHGVPGAMVSLVASAHLDKALHELNLVEPDAILNNLNEKIPSALNGGDSELNDGFDIALCRLDKTKSTLQFSGAHLNCWVLNSKDSITSRKSDGIVYEYENCAILELKGQRRGIGMSMDNFNFSSNEIKLEKGDKILVSTDGYQDQFGGEKNKKFKVKEMRNLILKNGNSTPTDLVQKLDIALTQWQGDFDQVDDICIMIVEV